MGGPRKVKNRKKKGKGKGKRNEDNEKDGYLAASDRGTADRFRTLPDDT